MDEKRRTSVTVAGVAKADAAPKPKLMLPREAPYEASDGSLSRPRIRALKGHPAP